MFKAASGSSEFLSFQFRWKYLFILLGAAAVYAGGLAFAYREVSLAEEAVRGGRAAECSQHLDRVAFLAGKPFLPSRLKARICGLLGDRAADAGETEEAMNYYQSEMRLLGGKNFTGLVDKTYLQSIAHPGRSPYREAYDRYLKTEPGVKNFDWSDSDLLPEEEEKEIAEEENAWPLLAAIEVNSIPEVLTLGDSSSERLGQLGEMVARVVARNESELAALHAAANQRKVFSGPEDRGDEAGDGDTEAVDCRIFYKLLRLEAYRRAQTGDTAGAARSLLTAFRMIGFIEDEKGFLSLITSLGFRKELMGDLEMLRESDDSAEAIEAMRPVVEALGARSMTPEFARECVKSDYLNGKEKVTDGISGVAAEAQLIRVEICRTYREYMREVLKFVEKPDEELVRDDNASMVPAVAFLRFARLAHFYGREDFSPVDGEQAAKLYVRAIASPVSERIRINFGPTGSVLAEVREGEADLVQEFAATPVKAEPGN